MLPAGTVLADRYRIGTPISEGGVGVVYEAIDNRDGSTVAIKVLRDDRQTEAARTRFQKEAEAAVNLRHPSLVRTYAFGEHDGHQWIAMERLRGESAADMLRRRGPLPPAEAVRIILAVLAGLDELHRQGFVHRDATLENIFLAQVDGENRVAAKLLDFGLTRPLDTGQTSPNELLGTVEYMPKEQLLHQPLDARTDIYSVGICLYRLLSNASPYGSRVGTALISHVISAGRATPLAAAREGIPQGAGGCGRSLLGAR